MDTINISKQTARRFVLGKQGLWPGRRWRGKKGTATAIRECEAVQLDPLIVIARSQDITLHSRVLDYKPDHLYQVAYKDREAFDYGGWLAMYPMRDLPYWRVHMDVRAKDSYVSRFVKGHQKLLDEVRAELRKRGPLGNRDFDGARVQSWSYRGRKETAVALFDMWLSGELMMHHRDGFNRVYDFRKNIAPKEFDYAATEKEAEKFFARKAVAFYGLKRESTMRGELNYHLHRDYSKTEMTKLLEGWKESGMVRQVQVEGGRDAYLVLGEDVRTLESLEKGRVPKSWNPKETTTLEEVTFLAPLDIVSARGRAKKLFDFEYTWEVYTPAHKRRWGYYVLPILYGDDLVARLDPKLDRSTMTLEIKGFWHEDDAPVKSADFANALAKGLTRFAKFVEAKKVDVSAIKPVGLRSYVKRVMRESS
ncbi:MAG TPA: crosslink repair DNA glycosylase YcaQ family protein [Anaerolineales bacterium]|nr:YcaQ family DNA glycosylase [Anaerolineales bacterium]HNQ93888.1 crosslink repair DNA glycosylase YcaQ family protein [Anaerolineales bacterium]HNS60143.1 crosslink repair DNA glycosylase YcaQ family protein [Anaerolineales bacterium]